MLQAVSILSKKRFKITEQGGCGQGCGLGMLFSISVVGNQEREKII